MSVNEITSLQKPPTGWVWSPEARERGQRSAAHNPRASGGQHPWEKSKGGPREDAEPTAHLPELMPGRDKLPAACIFCRSRLLSQEPPLGEHQRGMLTCSGCGRQLAWLLAPLPPTTAPTPSVSTIRAAARRALADVIESTAQHRVRSMRFERLDSCGAACPIPFGHDAVTHELYGRRQALEEIAAKPTGAVRTGALVVDFDLNMITLDGVELALTATERKILLYLAARPGRLCPYPEIVEALWGPEYVPLWGRRGWRINKWQPLRVHVGRIYPKLGPSRVLIETVPPLGYRLRMEPATGDENHG